MGKGMVRVYRDLEVYQTAFASAMEIFEVSKTFPVAERYSLTDQIRGLQDRCAPTWAKRGVNAVIKQLSSLSCMTAKQKRPKPKFG